MCLILLFFIIKVVFQAKTARSVKVWISKVHRKIPESEAGSKATENIWFDCSRLFFKDCFKKFFVLSKKSHSGKLFNISVKHCLTSYSTSPWIKNCVHSVSFCFICWKPRKPNVKLFSHADNNFTEFLQLVQQWCVSNLTWFDIIHLHVQLWAPRWLETKQSELSSSNSVFDL